MYCYKCMNETEDGVFCAYCGNRLDAAAALHHLTPGTLLNGKYRIGDFIGEGGFGITYIGRDENLDIRIAIKEYYPCGFVSRDNNNSSKVTVSAQKNADFFENGKKRFLQEARSLAKFSEEPGIVKVRDYFEENDTAYIVMEYLEGETLSKRIGREGRLEAEPFLAKMLPLMHSLKNFHQAGMIHRDISPDNIMFMKNGTLKLMDFGSARYFTNNELEMSVILKDGYSPEEQYRKRGNQGPWTDVYSLCATIYSCITGVIPENALDRLHSDTVQMPSQLGAQISPESENALMRGMAVFPENRCQSVEELLAAFGAVADGGQSRQNAFDPYKTYLADEGYDTGPQMGYGGAPPQSAGGPMAAGPSMGGPMMGRAMTGGPMTGGPMAAGPTTGGSMTEAPVTGGAMTGPAPYQKKPIILLSALIGAGALIVLMVCLFLVLPNLGGGEKEAEKTEAVKASGKKKEDGQKADEEEIEAVQMKPAEVKKLSKKYWKVTKDHLLKSTASSVIKQQEGVNNLPEFLFDGDIQTNWQEGTAGTGVGEYVSYEFKEVFTVNAMTFQLGNWKTKEYYYGNNRPKTLTIAMGGQSWTVTFPDEWVEFGLKFSSPVRTDDLKMTIDEVYKGSDWNDTVITDIGVWYE